MPARIGIALFVPSTEFMATFPAGVSWEGHTTLLKAVFLIFVSVFVSVIISCVQSVFLVLCPFLVLVIAKF